MALGRPRGFDLDTAIQKARDVFWRNGFDATSLATLAAAIGVHKPSLYAAYGDKRELYFAAYNAYQSDSGQLVASALGRPQFREALSAFFAADLDLFLAEDGRGCFMFATAVPLAPNDSDIAERARKSIKALSMAIVDRVAQADRARELSHAILPAAASDIILSTHIALANRARSGEERSPLELTAKLVIDLICAD